MFPILRSKKGHPVLFESGGGNLRSGSATLICGSRGERKDPIKIMVEGHTCNSDHALVPVAIGDYIITGTREKIDILKVDSFNFDKLFVNVVPVRTWTEEEGWDDELPKHLDLVVYAYFDKVNCYHCKHSHYVNHRSCQEHISKNI